MTRIPGTSTPTTSFSFGDSQAWRLTQDSGGVRGVGTTLRDTLTSTFSSLTLPQVTSLVPSVLNVCTLPEHLRLFGPTGRTGSMRDRHTGTHLRNGRDLESKELKLHFFHYRWSLNTPNSYHGQCIFRE